MIEPCDSGYCAVVTWENGLVHIRDSKLGKASPAIAFGPATWALVLDTARLGDLPPGANRTGETVRWTGHDVNLVERTLEFLYDPEIMEFQRRARLGDYEWGRLAEAAEDVAIAEESLPAGAETLPEWDGRGAA